MSFIIDEIEIKRQISQIVLEEMVESLQKKDYGQLRVLSIHLNEDILSLESQFNLDILTDLEK